MNTKNIFRTLLMAILLLVGANSAKADEITVWEGNASEGNIVTVDKDRFQQAGENAKLCLYFSGGEWGFQYAVAINNRHDANNYTNWEGYSYSDAKDGGQQNTWGGKANTPIDGHFELILSQTGADEIKKGGLEINSIKGLTFTKIIYVTDGSSSGDGGSSVLTYTLTIDIDGTTTTQQVAEGADLLSILPTPTKNGCIFTGWDGLPANGLMPAEALTVTALFVERAYVPATINSSTGYATFCSDQPLDFSGVTTVTAYYAAAVSDTEVTFKQIRGTVAAGTGLLLKGETSQIPVAETGTPASYPGNLLVGVTTDYDRVSGANLYVLVERNGKPVFAETAATPATVPAGKAYLSVLSSSNSRILTFSFAGEATSISAVETTLTGNEVIYNLRGQRVVNPGKGVYIINGKKVVLK